MKQRVDHNHSQDCGALHLSTLNYQLQATVSIRYPTADI